MLLIQLTLAGHSHYRYCLLLCGLLLVPVALVLRASLCTATLLLILEYSPTPIWQKLGKPCRIRVLTPKASSVATYRFCRLLAIFLLSRF